MYVYERAVGWIGLVNKEVLHRAKEERNILTCNKTKEG